MSQKDDRLKKFNIYLERAKALEWSGKKKEAIHQFELALGKLSDLIQYETNSKIKNKRQTQYSVLEKKIEQLSRDTPKQESPSTRRRSPSFDGGIGERDDYDPSEFDALINRCIEISPIKWDEICGLDDTKQIIKESIVLSLAQKESDVSIEGWSNILMYGPPGTGKTLLATATSNGLGATFFNVKIANVLSKYVGDSPKILSTLFRRAQEEAPSVIFIDEIEKLVETREYGNQTSTGLLQSFLAELDGFSTKSDDRFVLFMAATNVPWDVDDAILDRFEKRILIPLPDKLARKGIIELNINGKGLVYNGDFEELTKSTEGFSGRDIKNLCRAVSINMIREMNPGIADLAGDAEAAMALKLKTRSISKDDFKSALESFKPTTNPEILKKIDVWTKRFGRD